MFYPLLKSVQHLIGTNVYALDAQSYLEYLSLTWEYKQQDRPVSFEVLALQCESLPLRMIFNACHVLTASKQDSYGYVSPEVLINWRCDLYENL